MASDSLPPIATVPTLPTNDRAQILDFLFEPSVPLHTLSIGLLRQTFQSYDEMIAAIQQQLVDLAKSPSTSDTEWLESILASHPRLGEKKIESTQSQAEQAQLASTDASDEAKLPDMNALFERTFPGLRYVVFVNGRDRSAILDDMKRRVDRGNIELERTDAIKAMCDIASDRAYKSTSDHTSM